MFARGVPGLNAAGAAGACALAAPALVCPARVNPVLSLKESGTQPCIGPAGFAPGLGTVFCLGVLLQRFYRGVFGCFWTAFVGLKFSGCGVVLASQPYMGAVSEKYSR